MEWHVGVTPTGDEAWRIMRLTLSVPSGKGVVLPVNAENDE